MPTLRGTTCIWPEMAMYIVLSMCLILMPGIAFSQNVLFQADFENNSGDNSWTLQGGASDGNWLLGTPSPYSTGGFLMERSAFQGSRDLLTGQNFSQDVDGGPTRARSRTISLPQGSVFLDFEYYFAYNTSASRRDYFFLDLRRATDNALLQRITQERGSSAGKPAAWSHVNVDISAFAGQDVYLRVTSRDGGGGSKIEAAVDLVTITASTTTSIQGFVYEDLDVDGNMAVDEGGISGVIATLYQNGVQSGQATTDANGFYEFTSLTTGDNYQIIFSGWGSDVSQSVIGPDNQGSVQNVTVGQGFSNLGLYTTTTQCTENPFLIIPCYVEGTYDGSIASEPAIVKVRASADGHDFIGTNYTSDYEADAIADYNSVGTVYGLAWQPNHKVYYAGAFHKRYTSFGPEGPDAIYQLDLNGNVIGHISLDNLTGVTNSAGSDVHDIIPSGNGEVYDIGANNSSFDGVGKRSLGDVELSDDKSTLYVVNLFDRKIYALDVSSGNVASTTVITSWDAPDPTGSSRHRPFGLAWDEGLLWIGSVDENGQTGWIHSLDPQTGTFSLELTIPLQFDRQAFFGAANNTSAPAEWNAWQSDPNFAYHNVNSEIAYPQPMITDIEFATNGDMIIGFRDRFGDQSGAGKFFTPSQTARTWSISQGDILKACLSGGGFTLETGVSGTCPAVGSSSGPSGPNGQEFYYWDIYELEQNTWDPASNTGAFHWETTQGALIQLDGFDYVITTALDPVDDFSGGIIKLNNTTGAREGVVAPTTTDNVVGGYTIYEGGDYEGGLPPNNGYASKANGLGDIESACFLPLTIGNLVWYDVDGDGLQDETEPGLANVVIEIFEGGMKIGETSTDSSGYYYFGSFTHNGLDFGNFLEPTTTYELRVDLVSAQNNDGSISNIGGATSANSGSNDLVDSDGLSPGSYAYIILTTGPEGFTDYSFDFGYTACGVVTTTQNYEGCQGDGYTLTVGSSIYDEQNPSGSDTLQTINGCDSIILTELTFSPLSGLFTLSDTTVCAPDVVSVNADILDDTTVILSHLWTDLVLGTSTGYLLSHQSNDTLMIDASNASAGTIIIQYAVSTASCTLSDTMIVQILAEPVCEIVSDLDTLCSNSSLTLSAVTEYDILPDSGFVIPTGGVGQTLTHDIIGVQDPNSVKVIITLPTWDDHFDTMLLNGLMIFEETFQPQSFNAGGMNCQTPWVANTNGLPRSIIEITSSEVRYFSSLTPSSTSMTEVFPTNWTTTPRPFIQGNNALQFGIQNTAGPVSGSWYVDAIGTLGYTYLWSTGDTTQSVDVSPSVTTSYQVTVTAPSGCQTSCDKTIYVGADEDTEVLTYLGCSGDGYSIEVNNVIYDESNPSDTLVLSNMSGCDSIIIVDLTFLPDVIVEAGMPTGPICSNGVVDLNTIGSDISGGTTSGMWTSIGGGTFDNGGIFGGASPATTYIPNETEINQGVVILTLTSNDPPGPCEPKADAVMILINDVRCAQFPWAGGY